MNTPGRNRTGRGCPSDRAVPRGRLWTWSRAVSRRSQLFDVAMQQRLASRANTRSAVSSERSDGVVLLVAVALPLCTRPAHAASIVVRTSRFRHHVGCPSRGARHARGRGLALAGAALRAKAPRQLRLSLLQPWGARSAVADDSRARPRALHSPVLGRGVRRADRGYATCRSRGAVLAHGTVAAAPSLGDFGGIALGAHHADARSFGVGRIARAGAEALTSRPTTLVRRSPR